MGVYERDIYGEGLRFATECPVIAQAANELLADFLTLAEARDQPPLEMSIHAIADRRELPLQVTEVDIPIPISPDVSSYRMYRRGDCRLIDFPALGLFCLDPRAERIDGWLVHPEEMQQDQLTTLLRMALIELLHLRGLDAIHAAAVEMAGHGILLVGTSGRGKTTACLALVRAGYRCLSDDHPLLRETADGFELLPFPGRVNVTEQTTSMFPELLRRRDLLRPALGKRSFRLNAIFPGRTAVPCQPRLLIFPRIVDWPRSTLEPLPRARALEELLPEMVMVAEPQQTRRQFQTLSRLVQQVTSYRLHFGREVEAMPDLFESLATVKMAA